MATTSNGPQLFISFRGEDVRGNFLSYLNHDLRLANINVFIDEDEMLGVDLEDLLVRIEESQIALVIFSKNYTTSDWCLDELAKIKECKDQGRIKVIPIFYRVESSAVKDLTGEFGDKFRALERYHRDQPERTRKWKEALESIPLIKGMPLGEQSDRTEREFISKMVVQVQRVVASITKAPAKQPVKAANSQRMVASVVPARQLERETNPQGGFVIPIMVPARELVIDDIDDPMKWAWSTIYDGPNSPELEILKMVKIHWLKIAGTFGTGDLTPGKQYEAVFVVKLEDDACGWEQDVTLKLKVEQHNGSDRRVDRTSNLKEYISHDWVEILAGVFVVPPSNAPAKITFTMYQYETNYKKRGLLLKGVVIRPTN